LLPWNSETAVSNGQGEANLLHRGIGFEYDY
jgi:hypothetical protein